MRRGKTERLFISWRDLKRAASTAVDLDAEYYVPGVKFRGLPFAVRYVVQALLTFVKIIRSRPQVILFTNPPFVAGMVTFLAAKFCGGSIVADCHSGSFNDPIWARFAAVNNAMLRRCDGLIFHNQSLAQRHEQLNPRTIIYTAPGLKNVLPPEDHALGSYRSAQVTVPLSYSFDEPIQEIVQAARLLPEVEFRFTGRRPRTFNLPAQPDNVLFTGWLSSHEYEELLRNSSMVLCFTTRDDTMQSGLREAIQFGTPTIVSSSVTLKDWAEGVPGVTFVEDHSPESIAQAILSVEANYEEWKQSARAGFQHLADLAFTERSALERFLNDMANTR